MRSRKKPRRWFWRDVPFFYPVLVWIAFGAALLFYVSDWPLVPQQEAEKKPAIVDGEIYTGSIIVVPAGGDLCWQRMFDNRTGKQWDKGYVNCYEAVSDLNNKKSGSINSMRIKEISKTFRDSAD